MQQLRNKRPQRPLTILLFTVFSSDIAPSVPAYVRQQQVLVAMIDLKLSYNVVESKGMRLLVGGAVDLPCARTLKTKVLPDVVNSLREHVRSQHRGIGCTSLSLYCEKAEF